MFVHMLIAELLLQPQLVCDREHCLLYCALEFQLVLRPERQTHAVAPCIAEHCLTHTNILLYSEVQQLYTS